MKAYLILICSLFAFAAFGQQSRRDSGLTQNKHKYFVNYPESFEQHWHNMDSVYNRHWKGKNDDDGASTGNDMLFGDKYDPNHVKLYRKYDSIWYKHFRDSNNIVITFFFSPGENIKIFYEGKKVFDTIVAVNWSVGECIRSLNLKLVSADKNSVRIVFADGDEISFKYDTRYRTLCIGRDMRTHGVFLNYDNWQRRFHLY
jgi:hypothetical protein